ncbi:hypothetical protein PHAVU_001G027900 [Phaseolus vulgaris]|uniref:Uncharacterized protein n=1 Tax=Phaseolus vulgaris TaxID=3885 RepID=V7CUF2_PHAVU|nr:hypothetical protein PHAVU_001G027900g [Phaseolus vulgaris]ESW32910.1 hypothetical protein PHAVU_001G027900g [Phaseolus vulgaris]
MEIVREGEAVRRTERKRDKKMGICFSWLRPVDPRSKEKKRLASESVLVDACNAAESIQQVFEISAPGRAARAHQQAMAKQSANTNKGKPVLKY